MCREVKDEGQECVSTRWMCTLKEISEKLITKARLVARGFEAEDIEDKILLHMSENL